MLELSNRRVKEEIKLDPNLLEVLRDLKDCIKSLEERITNLESNQVIILDLIKKVCNINIEVL